MGPAAGGLLELEPGAGCPSAQTGPEQLRREVIEMLKRAFGNKRRLPQPSGVGF